MLMLAAVGLLSGIGCTSAEKKSSDNDDEGSARVSCTEPENPYDEGTGHYAGYEWAEHSGSGTCTGSSQSFVEGCEEYESQESEYQECEDQGGKH
jgi:hypothetical protein